MHYVYPCTYVSQRESPVFNMLKSSFLHPSNWYNPEAVAMIIYFDDSEVTSGCTAVVPREGDNDPYYKWPLVNNPGVAGLPWENDKDTIETILKETHPEVYKFRQDLYNKEKFATFKPGTVLPGRPRKQKVEA